MSSPASKSVGQNSMRAEPTSRAPRPRGRLPAPMQGTPRAHGAHATTMYIKTVPLHGPAPSSRVLRRGVVVVGASRGRGRRRGGLGRVRGPGEEGAPPGDGELGDELLVRRVAPARRAPVRRGAAALAVRRPRRRRRRGVLVSADPRQEEGPLVPVGAVDARRDGDGARRHVVRDARGEVDVVVRGVLEEAVAGPVVRAARTGRSAPNSATTRAPATAARATSAPPGWGSTT